MRDLAHAILIRLKHRQGVGVGKRGTPLHHGAGLLTSLPPELAVAFAHDAGLSGHIPCDVSGIGIGTILSPRHAGEREAAHRLVGQAVEQVFGAGVKFGFRDVEVQPSAISRDEWEEAPHFSHVVIIRPEKLDERNRYRFEDHLWLVEQAIRRLAIHHEISDLYPTLISHRRILYKHMCDVAALFDFFPEMKRDLFQVFAFVGHGRFATNTSPNTKRAQPCGIFGHNGEIVSRRGNVDWIRSLENRLAREVQGLYEELMPLHDSSLTDSGEINHWAQVLTRGRGLPIDQVMLLLVQQAFEKIPGLSAEDRAFLEYCAVSSFSISGPALLCFLDTDRDGNDLAGGVADPGGKRPAPWATYQWPDQSGEVFVLASEDGVVDEHFDGAGARQQIGEFTGIPENLIMVDDYLNAGESIVVRPGASQPLEYHREIVSRHARTHDYVAFTSAIQHCPNIPPGSTVNYLETARDEPLPPPIRFALAGLGAEDLQYFIVEGAITGHAPGGSMGNNKAFPGMGRFDSFYDHLSEEFFELTGPPSDARLEMEAFGSQVVYHGERPSPLVDPGPLPPTWSYQNPIISLDELQWLTSRARCGFIDTTYQVAKGVEGYESTFAKILRVADEHIEEGCHILVLMDAGRKPHRRLSRDRNAVDMGIALARLKKHLLDTGKQRLVTVIAVSDQVADSHVASVLIGFGATSVCPRGALELLAHLYEERPETFSVERSGAKTQLSLGEVLDNWLHSIREGVAISQQRVGGLIIGPYIGAKQFQPTGLDTAFVRDYLDMDIEVIEGSGLREFAEANLAAHRRGMRLLEPAEDGPVLLPVLGTQGYSPHGQERIVTPDTIELLQTACRYYDWNTFRRWCAMEDEKRLTPLDLLEFNFGVREPVPIQEVESVWSIIRGVFRISPISLGSISRELHMLFAVVMNFFLAISGTGEGGEESIRDREKPMGWNLRSKLRQFAAALFGVCARYLALRNEDGEAIIEVKFCQGAKPGEGGNLPGIKVTELIGNTRGVTPGVDLPSPAELLNMRSIEDAYRAAEAFDAINPGVLKLAKLVPNNDIGTIAVGARVAGMHPWLAGNSGGTGSAKRTSINGAGGHIVTGVVDADNALRAANLRDSTILGADGALSTPSQFLKMIMLGADKIGVGTIAMIVLGCMQMRDCHTAQCYSGQATQFPWLRKLFPGRPGHLIFFFLATAQVMRETLARLGYRSIAEATGQRGNALCKTELPPDHKGRRFAVERLLVTSADQQDTNRGFRKHKALRERPTPFDARFLNDAGVQAVLSGSQKSARVGPYQINNTHHEMGVALAGEIVRAHPELGGLPDGHLIEVEAHGVAGHNAGFCNVKGVRLIVKGRVNCFAALGMDGGELHVIKAEGSRKRCVGGEALGYGMSNGMAFVDGDVGKLAGVRLNGRARMVVERYLNNALMFQTGGMFISLTDPTERTDTTRQIRRARNIGAGATGGIGYFYSESPTFPEGVNLTWMWPVLIGSLEEDELKRIVDRNLDRIGGENAEWMLSEDLLLSTIELHYQATGSRRAAELLDDWKRARVHIYRTVPRCALNPARVQKIEEDEEYIPNPYFFLDQTPDEIRQQLEWLARPEGVNAELAMRHSMLAEARVR